MRWNVCNERAQILVLGLDGIDVDHVAVNQLVVSCVPEITRSDISPRRMGHKGFVVSEHRGTRKKRLRRQRLGSREQLRNLARARTLALLSLIPPNHSARSPSLPLSLFSLSLTLPFYIFAYSRHHNVKLLPHSRKQPRIVCARHYQLEPFKVKEGENRVSAPLQIPLNRSNHSLRHNQKSLRNFHFIWLVHHI